MTGEEAAEYCNQQNIALVEKKRLVLEVEVNSEDEAQEIMEWMYSDKKPMKASLTSVAWDSKTISRDTYCAIARLQEKLMDIPRMEMEPEDA